MKQFTHRSFFFQYLDKKFIDDMVAAHNELRSIHFSPPLQNNTEMSIEAKSFAMRLAGQENLTHSPDDTRESQGESLAMGCTTVPGDAITARESVMRW